MNPAMEALHARRRMAEWWTTPAGAEHAASVAEVCRARLSHDRLPGAFAAGRPGPPPGQALAARAKSSAAYWVSPDMAALVGNAASVRPGDHPVRREDLPARQGIALLERPAAVRVGGADGDGPETMALKALSWAESTGAGGAPGVEAVFYSAPGSRGDSLLDRLAAARRDLSQASGPLLVMHCAFLPFGAPLPDQRWWEMWPATFWHLLSQPVASLSEHEPDRQTRKQAERAGVPAGKVVVVNLRRPRQKKKDPDAERKWTLSHRVVVSADTGGHWMTVHTSDGPQIRWIPSYVKGPEGSPLVVRERVFAWKR